MSKVIDINFMRTWHQYLEALIAQQMKNGVFPGIEVLFAAQGKIHLHQAWGSLEIGKKAPPMQINTLFDIASMTKPMATATALMILQERGLLDLEDPVVEFVPEFQGEGKKAVTLRHLLTHTSGLPAWANLYEGAANPAEAWQRLMGISLEAPPEHQMIYSCLGFLILGEIIRRLTDQSLASFTKINIFDPLGMESTAFSPIETTPETQIAPTQYCPFRKKLLRGVVHDENSFIFQQEGGNAGLFSKAVDIYRFCQMIFNAGQWDGVRILSPSSIQCMLQNHNRPALAPRGLGWDMKEKTSGYTSCGALFPIPAFGHTGFTGTSFWCHPPTQRVVIVLTNRVHLSREQKLAQMQTFRPRLHNILMASLEPARAHLHLA